MPLAFSLRVSRVAPDGRLLHRSRLILGGKVRRHCDRFVGRSIAISEAPLLGQRDMGEGDGEQGGAGRGGNQRLKSGRHRSSLLERYSGIGGCRKIELGLS